MNNCRLTPPRDASVIVTYRCPMRCAMCNIWKYPTDPAKEIKAHELRTLPRLKFINITGGEPFVRDDLAEIVEECYRHAPRVVISTSGWFSERVEELAHRFPKIGIRISLEGLADINDELRGRKGGFSEGFDTLLMLRNIGLKDIGFACTLNDRNGEDMMALYRLARMIRMEFATAAVHNSFYFHKTDNAIHDRRRAAGYLCRLAGEQLRERHPKSWFRAWFNMGLANYVMGGERLLPCEAGSSNFFIGPYGEVYPCNGMDADGSHAVMGNIRESSFGEIWNSEQAERVRAQVKACKRQCWMVGTASPVMHKYIQVPARWVIANKLRMMVGRPPSFNGIDCM